ncbi:MAG: HAMP domain-containing histidine kinase [Rubrivivax sp.]|nr:HAMP domain-containing histidine kinase [Rubrivivax sp.]
MNGAPVAGAAPLPSLRRRLSRFVVMLALAWVVTASAVLTLWLRDEVEELLDDGLVATTEALVMVPGSAAMLPGAATAGHGTPMSQGAAAPTEQPPFAWQVLDRQGRLVDRSPNAPTEPMAKVPDRAAAGFVEGARGWRVRARPLGPDRWLLVGQESRERLEASLELAAGTTGAALLVSLAGLGWLRLRLEQETRPLADLAQVLARYDPLRPDATLPPPALDELQPVHAAVQDLGRRLAQHAAAERDFSAHAAHALRTPLAGLQAQLAVAQREAPAELQPRLARLRSATGRLSHVVGALLALFRSSGKLVRAPVDVAALVARVPLEDLSVEVVSPAVCPSADEDLLAAALINLLDNCVRHGARAVRVQVQDAAVTLMDDGPGVSAERLTQLRQAIGGEAGDAGAAASLAPGDGAQAGLGLALADRVARAHGGRLELLEVARGFGVRLWLGPPRTLPEGARQGPALLPLAARHAAAPPASAGDERAAVATPAPSRVA